MVPFVSPRSREILRADGPMLVSSTGERFPITAGIPRFVGSDSYAAAFGLEWKRHSKTLLDSALGTSISRQRLERCLGMPVEALAGKTVLEAGCGAGRFTELMVGAGALVHAVDLSVAVEANLENVGARPNYRVTQADIRALPFPPGAFDVVVCLGVLQHLPSPEEGMAALWAMLKPGGLLVIDHYTWTLSLVTKLAPAYRLLLKRLSPERAKAVTDGLVEVFFPLHWAVRRFRPAQMLLSRISPCLVYFRDFPQLNKEQHKELTRLDTYDNNTDRYKHLRTLRQIRRTLASLGGVSIQVAPGGNGVEARCRKPLATHSAV